MGQREDERLEELLFVMMTLVFIGFPVLGVPLFLIFGDDPRPQGFEGFWGGIWMWLGTIVVGIICEFVFFAFSGIPDRVFNRWGGE
jgi:hypothetical protein